MVKAMVIGDRGFEKGRNIETNVQLFLANKTSVGVVDYLGFFTKNIF